MSTLKSYSFLGSKAIKEKLLELKTAFNNASSTETVTEDVINLGTKTQDNVTLSTTLQHAPMPTDKISRVEHEKALPKCLPFEPGFEKLHSVPTKMSKRQTKKLKQLEKSKTKGKGWFDMPVQEMTEEKINDLKIIQMRGVLDPKHFYKKTDSRPGVLPKFFQTGSVVETSADFYSDRLPMKQRKKTLVDELLNDAEFKSFKKRKYAEVMAKTFSKKKKKRVC